MTKKKILMRITITVLLILAACTLLSRSIYLAMLPQVSTTKVTMGNIMSDLSYIGSIDYTHTQKVTAKAAWKFQNVSVKTGDAVEKGMVLAEIEMTDADLNRRQLELQLKRLQTQLKNTYGKDAKAEVQLAIDQARRQLDLFVQSYPKDGIIRAERDGRVLVCNYQTGDTAVPDSLVMNLQTEKSTPVVQWSVNPVEAEAMNVNSQVSLSFPVLNQGVEEDTVLRSAVSDKTQGEEMWSFEAELGSFNREIPLNAKAYITFQEEIAKGALIVPLSALTRYGDQAVLYGITTRQGVFGEENVVKQVEVEVLADNNISAAIKGTLEQNDRIVTYASKSLQDGAVVAVE